MQSISEAAKSPRKSLPKRSSHCSAKNISVISTNTGVELSDSDIELAYSRIELSKDALAGLSASNLEQGRSGTVLKAVRAYLSAPIVPRRAYLFRRRISAVIVINKK